MKLNRDTIEMMAIGVDKDDARFAAGDADIYSCDFEAEEITTKDEILPGWEDALPWGDHGSLDLTCGEIVEDDNA